MDDRERRLREKAEALQRADLARLEEQKQSHFWPVRRVLRGMRRRFGPMPKVHYTFTSDDW